MGDTASLGSFIARSSEACAAVVILGGAALVSWVASGGESAGWLFRSLGTGTNSVMPPPPKLRPVAGQTLDGRAGAVSLALSYLKICVLL